MSVLIGADYSHHNSSNDILLSADFIWLKATEGATYVDPSLNNHLEYIAREYALLGRELPIIGFYHFARRDNHPADPISEVKHFLKTVKPHIGQCLMCLDYEGDSVSTNAKINADWINDFCGQVYTYTGVMPFIYASASVLNMTYSKLNKCIPAWVAHYNAVNPAFTTAPYHKLMWQFTSKPFDMSLWYGTKSDLAEYALRSKGVEECVY